MAEKQVHECSTHRIKLCPENKFLVNIKKAEMGMTKASLDFSTVVNQIIEEWSEFKKEN